MMAIKQYVKMRHVYPIAARLQTQFAIGYS